MGVFPTFGRFCFAVFPLLAYRHSPFFAFSFLVALSLGVFGHIVAFRGRFAVAFRLGGSIEVFRFVFLPIRMPVSFLFFLSLLWSTLLFLFLLVLLWSTLLFLFLLVVTLWALLLTVVSRSGCRFFFLLLGFLSAIRRLWGWLGRF